MPEELLYYLRYQNEHVLLSVEFNEGLEIRLLDVIYKNDYIKKVVKTE